MQTIKNFFKKIIESNFIQSKKHEKILKILIIIVIALILFESGVVVGYKKANFNSRMGDNYYRAFENNDRGNKFMNNMRPVPNTFGGHGVVGKVIKTESTGIVVEGPDNIEKFINVNDKTLIKKFKDNLSIKDIQANDYVVILGEPNQNGEIDAKLIRLLPPPPNNNE